MKLIFSFFIILQMILSPVIAAEICVQPNGQPLTKDQSKTIKTLSKKVSCLVNETDLVMTKVMGSCLVEIVKGAFDFLVAQLEGLWDMLGMASDLMKKFGSFIVGYLKAAWNGTLPIFWAEQYRQGESFFGNIAKSLKDITQMVTGFFQKESETFRCLSLNKKVDYVCHAIGRVGPEVILLSLGIYKGVGTIQNLSKSIYPKLIAIKNAEKAAVVSRALKIQEATKLSHVKTIKDAKALSKTITEHPRPVESFEYTKVGKIIKDSRDLKDLDDGAYLYVIDSKGNVAITKRFPDISGKSEKVLANHPALKEQLTQSVGKNDVSAAGEFYVDAGEISEFNNKSGRFHGKAEHLDFAVNTMKKKGLQIKQGTKLTEYETLEKDIANKAAFRDPNHANEKVIAESIQTKFAKSPEMVKEYEDFKQAYREVYRNNPDLRSEKIGRFDANKLTNITIDYMENRPDKQMSAMAAMYYLDNASKESSRHFLGYFGITNGTFSAAERAEALEMLKKMSKPGPVP